ncbi:MAG TPA: Ig-like domain-containing protein, partial [Mycobacteriales bacterium]|nr:Ig-like domain-containing protein [Mycobacteriales bacterium]
NAQQVIPGPDGTVVLPAGLDLSAIHIVGRDLVINLPDGTQMVIHDGAVFVPHLVLGGVEVPSGNLAALLIDSEVQPAAGPPQSSGGNFADLVPPLDPGAPLGDLLPPTELVFGTPEFQPLFPGHINHIPTVIIETPDNPAGAVDASESVFEKGLPSRGSEPAGSGEIADGNASNNSDGDTATGSLTVHIVDDVPTARNDTDSVDLQSHIAAGNVMTGVGTTSGAAGADTVGADNAHVTGVTGAGGSDTSFDASGNLVVQGAYGTLTIAADGTYTYTANADAPGGATDTFTYTLTDGDGDTSSATLTISNPDHMPITGPNATVIVDDDDLPGGNPGGIGDL